MYEEIFSPKFAGLKNAQGGIFNHSRLMTSPPYVLVTESEICAASLEETGYAAVSVKHNASLTEMVRDAFRPIPFVVYIADNDVAGERYAAWFQKVVPHAVVRRPPEEFSDTNAAIVAGQVDWLTEFAEPLL